MDPITSMLIGGQAIAGIYYFGERTYRAYRTISGTLKYDESPFSPVTVSRARDLVARAAKDLGVNKKIEVVFCEKEKMPDILACAAGSDFGPGQAAVFLAAQTNASPNPPGTGISIGNAYGIIAHEVAHIRYSDWLTRIGLQAVIWGISFVALAVLFPSATVLVTCLPSMISWVAGKIISRHQEWRADKAALAICNDEEKRSFLKIFQRFRESNKQRYMQKSTFQKIKDVLSGIPIWPTANGNNLMDLDHPLDSSRIRQIEESLGMAPDTAPALAI